MRIANLCVTILTAAVVCFTTATLTLTPARADSEADNSARKNALEKQNAKQIEPLKAKNKKRAKLRHENEVLKAKEKNTVKIAQENKKLHAKQSSANEAYASVPSTVSGYIDDSAPKTPQLSSGFFVDASIDGMYSHRNSAEGAIVTPLAGPGSIISSQDFPFGDSGGYDARLRAGYQQWSLEGRYLGGFHWGSSVHDLGAIAGAKIGSFSNFGATHLSASDTSSLDSWEINARWQLTPWFTPFVGYRTIHMSDQTDINIAFPAFTALYYFSTPWNANGPQIGAEVRLFGPGTPWQPGPFFGDVDARVGYYHITADTNFNLLPSTGGSFPGGSSYSDHGIIYELGAALGYRFTPNFEMRAGYRYLAIPNALFANDYAAAANAQSSQNIVPNTRRLDLQMVTLGIRIMFH